MNRQACATNKNIQKPGRKWCQFRRKVVSASRNEDSFKNLCLQKGKNNCGNKNR